MQQAYETESLRKSMHELGGTRRPEPSSPGKKRWTPTSMVYFAIAAILATVVLATSMRGCHQQHSYHHDAAAARRHESLSGNVEHASSEHVLHAGAAALTSESSIDGNRLADGEVRRHEGKTFGMVRRASASSSSATTTSAASATGTVLVDYQVHQPVLTPEGATLDSGVSNGDAGDVLDPCQVVLMDHVFAYSYGEPYIGKSMEIYGH